MRDCRAAFSAEDSRDHVAGGCFDCELADGTGDFDFGFLDEDVGAEGGAGGLLAVGAVADDLRVLLGDGDGDGGAETVACE